MDHSLTTPTHSPTALVDAIGGRPADQIRPRRGRRSSRDWKASPKRLAGIVADGLYRLFGSRHPDSVGILVYHRVSPNIDGLPSPTMNVQPQRFRSQLVGLLDRGFCVWPLWRVLAHRAAGESIPGRTIVITFDDGFENVYTQAWPILRELGLPSTVFVSTAFLDGDLFPFDPWGTAWATVAPPDAYRPLRSAQCTEMLTSGLVELGAHTHTHQDFRGRPEAFEADLRTSVVALADRFGVEATTFAFPFGRPHLGFVSPELVAAARRTGVVCGLTTRNDVVGTETDPFDWGRFNAFDTDSAAVLAAKLGGWYGWAPALQEWLARAR